MYCSQHFFPYDISVSGEYFPLAKHIFSSEIWLYTTYG